MKLVFLGAPGSGKGTHASRLKLDLNVPHISTGDIFRANIKGETPLGIKAKSFIDNGQLVPDELTIELVRDRLSSDDCRNGFILDGFPRTIAQAEALKGFSALDAVVNFVLDSDTIVERISKRRMCVCGETYNLALLNGSNTCAKCGKELYQRADDKEETVRKRLEVYERETAPLIGYYREEGLISDLDCNGKTIDEVYENLKSILKSI